jgi:hypothetical protein
MVPNKPATAPKPGRGPKPVLPKKSPALSRLASTDQPTTLQEKIDKALRDSPSLISAITSQSPSLPIELQDFSELINQILEEAKNSANDASVQYKKSITLIQSQRGVLIDPSMINDSFRLIKAVEMLTAKLHIVSSHLQ